MSDFNLPKYDRVRSWIRTASEHGWTWEAIAYMNQNDMDGLRQELHGRIIRDFWPMELSAEGWLQLVHSEEEAQKSKLELAFRNDSAFLTDKSAHNGVSVPNDPNSSWVLYKKHLKTSGFNEDSINEIETATLEILGRLAKEMPDGKPVKGMVVGHVQSGKTANMAALMAMAADWGWNMFIVLSGTIENLRKQTQNRLFNDLHREGNIQWTGLEHLSIHSSLGQRVQDLNFLDIHKRYFSVCLKNPKRLEHLIKWMQADLNKLRQMKVIVIDDESDQGGINTAKKEADRSRINKLIVNLVEGKNPKGNDISARPMAMNYIGYTATPYANFLNESLPESLYPRNFIRTLQPSNEYFGPKQIFGVEGTEECDGLDILRTVVESDLEQMKQLHKSEINELPDVLIESLIWFLCAASAMRLNGYTKPISMLVHTSQLQQHHQSVAEAIGEWLENARTEGKILSACEEVWERETSQFSSQAFVTQFKSYPLPVKDYPVFSEIKSGIMQLVSEISHIPMNEDNHLDYHEGIHLCIDNCSNNGVNDENMVVRLAYPDPASPNRPKTAPAFIVVGGSTLSRGLTIEGLVSTFFLRASIQADSLMQMGRWFGYRRGYELYPRIWMTKSTQEKFRFLAQLEHELRDDLKRYMVAGEDPSQYGPRIKNTPKATWLRITAANKMKNVTAAEMDFSGTNVQTVVFSEEKEILEHNIKVTEKFLQSLGEGTPSRTKESIIWRKVPFERIKDGLFINQYKFHSRASVFNQMEAFCEWYEKSAEEAGYQEWNVLAAGVKSGNANGLLWEVPGGTVGKVNRTRLGSHSNSLDKSVSIGVLRAPKDLYEDIPEGAIDPSELMQANNESIRKARADAGLGTTPLLILYRINKDSKPSDSKTTTPKEPATGKVRLPRVPLGVEEDVIGMSIWVPGVKSKTFVKTLTVKISREDIDAEDEAGDMNDY
ncbi:Z1 domain-containing protein [Brevibacillus centrosporus]|uniref:Z1 domain-containing protein n=1 Tax=Brevibacillus centrosporus TaxID=54910 RepID=UPI002E1A3A4E|nr:Z1 domain-containing protein [Brevibacillus centrosporus]